ncbi:uncharacterized protein LOC112565801 isoform X1 [Pomacea canaliculata]|uniref:uncharacterized protein LOC112565801 isoform X1 n=2 Tax=Pomacea canaliculata TaxID=400727 RepID=UPI000D7293CC|nr:uncharacterized protein LOC112565801 isoform X1 [Pomacea canaliculata]XP_025097365.1 uncharacterized protein LOC112565801 isoform X1 [Pomacea canaliculata]XP_025097366.1 uncharacterized protein LOC112565801 isoform X1 [Pomacea canaliculata]XP_025097367.1 uncharacterized protein LOC112565801 isoform X1 [Pomacea canaliculata]XP_025097368.1 uncharacterized protein LOC112565801 isoform X1 [Pomacea canaliculata]
MMTWTMKKVEMSDDDDPDDLRYLKRTRDKESKKTKKEGKKNEDKYENRIEDGEKEDGKNENGKNEPKEKDKNMDTGGISDEANAITMIAMRESLNMQGIMINAILQENSLLEKVLYLQLSLGGERLSSIQTRELIVARNGTLENRNIRRFYSPFLTTSSPWSRTCPGLCSWSFRSPVSHESILTVENVVTRGYTVSLFKIIILNYTNAQMCFSALQEEFTAGIASLNLIQPAGDDSYGLFRWSFGNSGSLLIINDATKGRRLILATTPLSFLNESRILLVWQEAFTAGGVNLQLVQAAEDNSSRAIIVRTQFWALVPVEVLRFRCEPYSGPHNSDGRQSQGVLRPLRSRERPQDLGDLDQESLVSVVASMDSEQANMPASRTRAKEWSCAIPGRCDSACGSAPSPRCKIKAKGPSPESSSSKRNTIRSTNVGFERNKDPVNMNAALKPPRHLIHRNTFPASKGDDEMFFSGTMAAHSKRRLSSNTLLNYSTQCTDTGGHAVACDSKGKYESACKAESEDVCTEGTSCKRPVMETGWQLYNAREDVQDKIIVDGTNTSGNNGRACRKTTGIKGETETKLRTPVQCEDLCSVHHNNASGHMTRANGDPDLGNQGEERRRPVPKGNLRMHGTVLYAQCEDDLLFEYSWKLEEEHRQVMMRLLCRRCRASPWSVVLIPCGHLLCSSCYQTQQSCPICHEKVDKSSHALLS